MDLCEFEDSLVYRVSSRTGSTATEKPCLEKQKQKQTKQKRGDDGGDDDNDCFGKVCYVGSTVFTLLRVLERHRHTEVMMVLCGACVFEQE